MRGYMSTEKGVLGRGSSTGMTLPSLFGAAAGN